MGGEELFGFTLGRLEFDVDGLVGSCAGTRLSVSFNKFVSVFDAGFVFIALRFGAAFEPCNFFLDFHFHGLLLLRLRFENNFPAFEKIGIIARNSQAAAFKNRIDFDDAIGDVVEKVTIVCDDKVGELSGFQEVFEPEDAFEVEMVGGLVKQEQVGFEDELAGESESFFPAAGERVDRDSRVGKSDFGEDDGRFSFSVVIVDKPFVEVCIAESEEEFFARCICKETVLLSEVSDFEIATGFERAIVGMLEAGEDFQERGFPGSVRAKEPDTLIVIEAQGDIGEQPAMAKGFGEILTGEQE